MNRAGVIAGGILAAAAVWGSGAEAAAPDPVRAAFVVLGQDGAPQARVITVARRCPAVTVDGRRRVMRLRAGPATLPQRPTRSAPEDSKPSAFPVRVCEAQLPAGARRAAVAGRRLPLPAAEPRRIVVIGDTGCRIKKSDRAYQACNDPRLYPFARVSASAARWKPDLVIHVGDYLYRENACDSDHPGCKGSVWGYGWDAWNADFFRPGRALLAAAPWIAVRGNHESCNRAGQGWWRLVDPRPLVPGRDCNDPKDDDVGDYSDPYAVPIGEGGQVIVLDSSNAVTSPIKPDSVMAARYRDAFAKYEALAARAPHSIMVQHHPVLAGGATTAADGKVSLFPGNLGLQSVWGPLKADFTPPTVKLLLSGHVHVWQAVAFSSGHPAQFVSGFAGTQEDIVPLPREWPADAPIAPGAVVSMFSSWVDGFGFMTMARFAPDGWDVEVHDVDGRVVNHCKVTGRQAVCDTPQVVVAKAQ